MRKTENHYEKTKLKSKKLYDSPKDTSMWEFPLP